jgi:hypothetical protein
MPSVIPHAKIKLSSGMTKVQKLLGISSFWDLEKKLCEVPKGQAVVLLDKHYTKIDCGKFIVLVPRKVKKSKKG